MKRWVACLAATVTILSAGKASAQAIQNVILRNSFNPVGAGARGLGMGGAFIAVADDGTASSFNPAGLAQLRRSELAIVGFKQEVTSTLSGLRLGTGDVETTVEAAQHTSPDFVGLAIPFELASRNLTVQISYQRTVDLFGKGKAGFFDRVPAAALLAEEDIQLLRIPPTTPVTVRAEVVPEQSGAFHTASLALGYEVTSRLSVGASMNYWVAEWNARGRDVLRFSLEQLRPGQSPIEFFRRESQFQQDQGLRGLNLNLGFLLKYPRISIGGVARLPFVGDYELTETIASEDFVLGKPFGSDVLTTPVTTRLHWPRSLGAGVALRPFRGLTLAGDYTRSHWSRAFIEDLPDGALFTQRSELFNAAGEQVRTFTDRNFFDLLPASQTDTVDTQQWRGGAEYLLTAIPKVVVPFRVGIFRDRSPIVEPSGEGRRMKGWTVGTGLNFNRVVLDLAFERRESEGFVGQRFAGEDEEGPIGVEFLSTESVRQDRIVAALIYRAGGPDDPIKRLIRYLFVGPREKEDN